MTDGWVIVGLGPRLMDHEHRRSGQRFSVDYVIMRDGEKLERDRLYFPERPRLKDMTAALDERLEEYQDSSSRSAVWGRRLRSLVDDPLGVLGGTDGK